MSTGAPLDCKKTAFLSIKAHLILDRIGYLSYDSIHLQKDWGGGEVEASAAPVCLVSTNK